jgi:hypothetical protein
MSITVEFSNISMGDIILPFIRESFDNADDAYAFISSNDLIDSVARLGTDSSNPEEMFILAGYLFNTDVKEMIK